MGTTELSFLIELLLKHKLPPATKLLIAERIKEVETAFSSSRSNVAVAPRPLAPGGVVQAASTQAILDRNPDLIAGPVAVVAQTPATAAALESRTRAINSSLNREINKETGRPRKF